MELVYTVCVWQGDLEKEQLKLEPIPMMDRRKKDELPRMQVSFIDEICLPVYQTLAAASPDLLPMLEGKLKGLSHEK